VNASAAAPSRIPITPSTTPTVAVPLLDELELGELACAELAVDELAVDELEPADCEPLLAAASFSSGAGCSGSTELPGAGSSIQDTDVLSL
jgi:hypothetical protein